MSKSWKELLLKSGLPLEYEVKESFFQNGCVVWDEYTYLRRDEDNTEKEFSYDLSANTLYGRNWVEFLIECKYKSPGQQWVFLPDPYGYQHEISKNSFIHSIDRFVDQKAVHDRYPLDKAFPLTLGPMCLKGVEISGSGYSEAPITRAINQLAYAFVHQVVSGVSQQLDEVSNGRRPFFIHNIPLVVTTAELYLLREKTSIQQILESKEITDVADEHDFLLFHHQSGQSLQEYNRNHLGQFFGNMNDYQLKALGAPFREEREFFLGVVAVEYCPRAILFMRHKQSAYEALFNYLRELFAPSQATKDAISANLDKLEEERSKAAQELVRRGFDHSPSSASV